MQIAFALIAIFWWIAVWGLSDLLTDDWTKQEKFAFYIVILVAITIIVYFFPKIVERF